MGFVLAPPTFNVVDRKGSIRITEHEQIVIPKDKWIELPSAPEQIYDVLRLLKQASTRFHVGVADRGWSIHVLPDVRVGSLYQAEFNRNQRQVRFTGATGDLRVFFLRPSTVSYKPNGDTVFDYLRSQGLKTIRDPKGDPLRGDVGEFWLNDGMRMFIYVPGADPGRPRSRS